MHFGEQTACSRGHEMDYHPAMTEPEWRQLVEEVGVKAWVVMADPERCPSCGSVHQLCWPRADVPSLDQRYQYNCPFTVELVRVKVASMAGVTQPNDLPPLFTPLRPCTECHI